jgi:NhaA family Na+:H+ antiporter
MAVVVIALFYTSTISWGYLALAAGCLTLLIAANALGIRHPIVYAVVGIGGLWFAFLLSGVHATIAGVLAAMTIPARTRLGRHKFLARGRSLLRRFEEVTMSPETPPLANRQRHEVTRRLQRETENVETPLQRLEHALHPWVTGIVMPVFALANAGVTFGSETRTVLMSPIFGGVMLGLLVGKPVGIVLGSWLAVRIELTTLPEGVTWSHLIGVGFLAGIGFTMSLFITGLAFRDQNASLVAKVGILLASALAGSIGWGLLRRL